MMGLAFHEFSSQQNAGRTTMDNIAENILYASKLINSPQLQSDAVSLCNHLNCPAFRIAVFAPFNHGKSTLLNALLGSRALPVALIPTTGAAIAIKYGSELQTHIKIKDGKEVIEKGTAILQKFAVLDGDRCMREDVASVEVTCPHPLLAKNIELIDLPGTDDMEAQDSLVYNRLLTSVLVIQVLDARKLFTLGEVNKTQAWLQNRGVKTSIFVLNFLNLLAEEERQDVISRARSIAAEFRGDLPNNISNLYRVDALPALRARTKGVVSDIQGSGIVAFESALHDVVDLLSPQAQKVRLPRVIVIAKQLKQTLEAQSQPLEKVVNDAERDRIREIEQLEKESQQLKQAFQQSISNFQNWLSSSNLIGAYQSTAANALRQENFRSWETGDFKRVLSSYQETISNCVDRACDRLKHKRPSQLSTRLGRLEGGEPK
jgi:hypothetical protein